MIAHIGTGLLGSAFVRAALRRGEQVNVWNRTIDKAAALGHEGAKIFPAIADTIRGASHVHLVLSDDDAVETVLKEILPAFGRDSFIIDHTTTSVAGAASRTQHLAALGVIYQHCPVFMSPQNALESAGVMLISGQDAIYARLKSYLERTTGKLVYLGVNPGRAAALKLAGNLMLMAITTGLADTAAFLKAVDVPRSEINTLFEHFNPGASVEPRAKRMLAGNYENPSWELQMARKDARLILSEAAAAEPALQMVPQMAAMMDTFIAKGCGNLDWTVIGRESL